MNLAEIKREFREVPLALVDEPQLPSRGSMDDVALEELTESIRDVGLLQPVILAHHGERFEVVAGHRRTVASRRAGLVTYPAIVYPSLDVALEALKYAENRHREELSAGDEAIWFAELLERHAEGDVDKLCALLGERRSYVESRLLLFQGDTDVLEALIAKRITIGVAQQLNRCPDPAYRRMYLHQAISGGATVSVVSGWISEYNTLHRHVSPQPESSASTAAPSAVPETNFFTCLVCDGTEDVHTMQPKNIHAGRCARELVAALEMYRRRSDYVRAPRSAEEASELINDLADRWLSTTSEGDPRRI